jgi:hypothetical protein
MRAKDRVPIAVVILTVAILGLAGRRLVAPGVEAAIFTGAIAAQSPPRGHSLARVASVCRPGVFMAIRPRRRDVAIAGYIAHENTTVARWAFGDENTSCDT